MVWQVEELQAIRAIGYCPFGYRYREGVVEPDPDQWGPARERWEGLMALEMNCQWIRPNEFRGVCFRAKELGEKPNAARDC